MIKSVLSQCDLLICDLIELHVLGKELTDQPIQVLVRATLPCCMRMREVIFQPELVRDLLMQGELFPVIRGQSVRQMGKGS